MTPIAERMAKMDYVVDRMHFRGHVDPWCHEKCNPDKLAAIDRVHTVVLMHMCNTVCTCMSGPRRHYCCMHVIE